MGFYGLMEALNKFYKKYYDINLKMTKMENDSDFMWALKQIQN